MATPKAKLAYLIDVRAAVPAGKTVDGTGRTTITHVHSLVESLERINRSESDAPHFDLRRVKTRALHKLIVANAIADKRIAFKLPAERYYDLDDRTLDSSTRTSGRRTPAIKS